FFFFQAEDGIRDFHVTGVQTCALPIFSTGMAAIFGSIFPLIKPGNHIVSCLNIFGSSRTIFSSILPDWGVSTSYFNADSIDKLRSEERRVGKECRARVVRDDR